MASLTQWTWICVDSLSWWWTRRPGVLGFMGLHRVGQNWAVELTWPELSLSFYFIRKYEMINSSFTWILWDMYAMHRNICWVHKPYSRLGLHKCFYVPASVYIILWNKPTHIYLLHTVLLVTSLILLKENLRESWKDRSKGKKSLN